MKTNELIEILRDESNPNVLDYIDEAADVLEAQQKRIEQLEAERRWIPVTERLPEPTENPVLVPYAGSVWTAWRHADYWELGGVLNTVCVNFWMPMPEPPKGE